MFVTLDHDLLSIDRFRLVGAELAHVTWLGTAALVRKDASGIPAPGLFVALVFADDIALRGFFSPQRAVVLAVEALV